MSSTADISLVHISDIHFRSDRVGTLHDADEELREQLLSDLRRLAPRFGPIDGILITGDIAWSGHTREYQYAESWIRNVAGHLRCEASNVMVTPGNHDIYRPELVKDERRIAKLHQKIRRGANSEVTVERLTSVLNGDEGKLLLAPLKAYNKFAKQFSCDISPSKPYWERPFHLGDGSTLLIRGITSTWLSGPTDSERTARLLYGAAQYRFPQQEATQRIVAGHHPPQNMIDGETAAQAFEFHTRLQLFGHKHTLWISPTPRSARIVAGALHPDRREKPWVPRYNILEVSMEAVGESKSLTIRVYPRRWSEEFRQFMADFKPDATEPRVLQFPC